MRKPLVILVSGAPGSGKTTLAHNLAQYMRLPHIPRDEILRGLEMTNGGDIDKGGMGIEAYYRLLAHMCEAGVSLVTDGTLYAGISEEDIKSILVPSTTVVNVHVRARNEHDRFILREKQREGWSSEWVDTHIRRLDSIYHQTVDPLDLGVPVLEVDATDGYEPSIMGLAGLVRKVYMDTRPGLL